MQGKQLAISKAASSEIESVLRSMKHCHIFIFILYPIAKIAQEIGYCASHNGRVNPYFTLTEINRGKFLSNEEKFDYNEFRAYTPQ